MNSKKRCAWCNVKNPIYVKYHDEEWCKTNFDERYLYEMLILESFQAGLSWECVLNKRKSFRAAYDNFDLDKVCQYDDSKISELLNNKSIIRNKLKIKASINNSKIFKDIVNEYGSFYNYLITFSGVKILYETDKTTNELSDLISADLKKRGMKFVGSTIIYSYLQAIGLIYSHEKGCYLHKKVKLMIDINSWLKDFSNALNQTFGDRAWFVGLQGSFSRNEASDESDIDVVVILDELNAEDISTYNAMLDKLQYREKICGFLSGKSEIFNWEASDLFQFCHDTIPLKGSLDELLLLIDSNAIERAIKIGVCNIYHGCVHNMLHEKSAEVLKGLYKSAIFVIQAICFKTQNKYIRLLKDLLTNVSPDERLIIEGFLVLKNNGDVDFERLSDNLFNWCKKLINA